MKLHEIPIGIVLISAIVAGMVLFIGSVGDYSGRSLAIEGLNNTQAQLEVQTNISEEINQDIKDFVITPEGIGFDTPYRLVVLAWKSGKSLFNSWYVVGSLISESASSLTAYGLPVPGFIVAALSTIILFILIAIVIYAFFKWKWEV